MRKEIHEGPNVNTEHLTDLDSSLGCGLDARTSLGSWPFCPDSVVPESPHFGKLPGTRTLSILYLMVIGLANAFPPQKKKNRLGEPGEKPRMMMPGLRGHQWDIIRKIKALVSYSDKTYCVVYSSSWT